MTLDYSEFRPYLAGLGMSETQENEFMTFVWNMMKGFVDRAWGIDSTQLCLGENASASRKFAVSSQHRLESKLSLKGIFNAAARRER